MAPAETPDVAPGGPSLGALLVERLERRGSAPALSTPDRSLDGAECARAVRRFAAALAGTGVGAGDRVAVMLPNVPEFPLANVGAWLAGALYVPVNVMLGGRESTELLADAEPRVLVTSAEVHDRLPASALAGIERIVRVGDDGPDGWDEFLAAGDERRGTPSAPAPAAADRTASTVDAVTLAYTSGTTGVPKGALIAGDQIDLSQRALREVFGLGPDDVILQVLPYFHSNASLTGVVLAWWLGARAAMLPRFSPEALAQLVERERVTFGACVPTVMYDVANAPSPAGSWDSMRHLLFGAMSLPPAVRERFEAVTGVETVSSYGMTEAPNAVVCDPLGRPRIAGTVGVALPHVRLVAVDDDGRPLPAGEVGELAIEPRLDGPYAGLYRPFAGYRGRSEETRRATAGGRFRTGDIGSVDGDGYVRLVDRKKDMISVAGFKVYPAELEAVLLADERIAEAYVVGAADERRGEVPFAFVVAAEDARLAPDDVVELARKELAAYKRLGGARVCTREELPRNALGKVLKRALRESALAGESADR